jgi:hypothetical protein
MAPLGTSELDHVSSTNASMNLDHVRWFARSDLLGSRPARSRNVGLGL